MSIKSQLSKEVEGKTMSEPLAALSAWSPSSLPVDKKDLFTTFDRYLFPPLQPDQTFKLGFSDAEGASFVDFLVRQSIRLSYSVVAFLAGRL